MLGLSPQRMSASALLFFIGVAIVVSGVDDSKLQPWRSAIEASAERADVKAEEEAEASGFLATGDESPNWYLQQAAHVENRQIRKHNERHAKLEAPMLPVIDHREEKYRHLAKLSQAKARIKSSQQAQDAVNIQALKNAEEHQKERELAEVSEETDLGETEMTQVQNAVKRRARHLHKETLALDLEASREHKKKAHERAQKHSYAREVTELGEEDDANMESHAVAVEGNSAELLKLKEAAENSKEKADEASESDEHAAAAVEDEVSSIRDKALEFTEQRHKAILAKFQLLHMKAKHLVEHGELLDDDKERRAVETEWNKYLVGSAVDADNDVDIKTQVAAEQTRMQAMSNLPNVRQAKTSADPVAHPCGAIDRLNGDALCSLETKLDELKDIVKGKGKVEHNSIIEDQVTDLAGTVIDPVLALQVSEGAKETENAGYVTLHASTADKEITAAKAVLDKEASKRAQRVDAAAEHALEEDQKLGETEAAEGWHLSQKSEDREIQRGQFALKRIPDLMKQRTEFITKGAIQRTAWENKLALSAESEEVHNLDLEQEAQAAGLQRSVQFLNVQDKAEEAATRARVHDELKIIATPTEPAEPQSHARDVAATKISDMQQELSQVVDSQNRERAFQQQLEFRQLHLVQNDMAGEQKAMARVIDPILDVEVNNPA